MKNKTFNFDSVADFLADATDGADIAHSDNRLIYTRQSERAESGWYGMDRPTSADDLRAMIRAGWTDGANRVEAMAAGLLVPRITSVRRRRVRGDHGDALDIGQVYAGALDTAWTRTAKASSDAPPRIRIVTDMAASASVEGRAMFWRGAAALALADALNQAGHTIELVTSFKCRYKAAGRSKKTATTAVNITTKAFTAPLDISTLAVSTALAGFFRCFGFLSVIKHAPLHIVATIGHGVAPNTSDYRDDARTLIAPGHIETERAARTWITDTIANLTDQPAAA